jgi:hypothetical protein
LATIEAQHLDPHLSVQYVPEHALAIQTALAASKQSLVKALVLVPSLMPALSYQTQLTLRNDMSVPALVHSLLPTRGDPALHTKRNSHHQVFCFFLKLAILTAAADRKHILSFRRMTNGVKS